MTILKLNPTVSSNSTSQLPTQLDSKVPVRTINFDFTGMGVSRRLVIEIARDNSLRLKTLPNSGRTLAVQLFTKAKPVKSDGALIMQVRSELAAALVSPEPTSIVKFLSLTGALTSLPDNLHQPLRHQIADRF